MATLFYFIYGLKDPETNQIKYIGQTTNPMRRLKEHINNLDKSMTPKKKWLLGLKQKGLQPRMIIFTKTQNKQRARELEHEYYNKHKQTILNIHDPAKGAPSRRIENGKLVEPPKK